MERPYEPIVGREAAAWTLDVIYSGLQSLSFGDRELHQTPGVSGWRYVAHRGSSAGSIPYLLACSV
jgi:hypothetical protein